LGEQGIEVDVTGVTLVDAVERRKDLLGEADALGAPVREQEENGGVAVFAIDARGFVRGEERERKRNGREMSAQKGVLAAGFVDGNGVVGCESGRKSRVEFGYGLRG
jgi:hypothetical protein